MKNKILAIVLAALAPGFAVALPMIVSFATNQNNVLVYCPPTDAAGCEKIIAAVGGGTKAYDGSEGTVDLKTADLSAYTALIVPSLADVDGAQPYALLRDADVATHLGQSLHGRRVFWSGAPDLGSENRTAKDALIARLATYASSNHENVGAPGLVVLLDRSSSNRYGWVHSLTGINVVADPAIRTYSSVRTVTTTGTDIVGGAAYSNMASYGFYLPQGAAGIRMDAIGQTLTSVGGQIVLMTHPGANEHEAVVSTDRDDYAPGETVMMNGGGFVAGESVTLRLVEDPEIHDTLSFSVVADSIGSFVFTDFAPDEHDVDVRFILTATGETSGRQAETTFTDAIIVAANLTGNTGATGANQISLAPPTNSAGDVLIAHIVVTKFSATQFVCPPTGWTSVLRTNNVATGVSDVMQHTFVHVATTPLTGAQNFSFRPASSCTGTPVASRHASGAIVAYSGVDNTTPIDVAGGDMNSSSVPATAPSVVTTTPNTRVVRLTGIFKNLTPTPSADRIYSIASASGNERVASAWSATQAVAGATGAFAATHASALWVAQTIALREAAATQTQATATAVDGGGTFNGTAFTGSGTCSNSLTPVITYSGGSAPINAGSTTFTVTCGDGGVSYIDGTAQGSIVITPALVTATAGSGSAAFDGATKSPSACSVTGAYVGDLACTNNPASVGPNVGTTPIAPSVTGTGIGTNFTVTPANGSFTISQAQAVATPTDGGGTFNGAAFTGSGTCSGGLTAVITYSGGSAPVNAGSTTFTVTCGDGGNNFIDGTAEGEIEILPALVTATAGSGSADYDGTAKSPSVCVIAGAYVGDLSCSNDPASVGPGVGTTPINPDVSGTGLGNFSITPVAGSYTISQAQAEATATDGGGTFNGTAFTANGICSNDLTPVIAYSGGSAPVNAGTTTFTVTCGDGGNNYINDVDEGEIVITPALVTATAGSGSATFDGSSKSPSACSVTGAYTGDLACTNSPASVGPNVGTTPIAPSVTGTGIGTNFTVTSSDGSYTINPAQATASAIDNGGSFNGSAFTGSGTCSNSLTAVIVYSGGSAPVNAGSTTFTVTCGDGGNNYIDDVDEGDIVITPALVTATAGGGSATYDGSEKSPSACSVTGAYLGDLSCNNSPPVVGPNAGTTTINPILSGTGIGTNFTVSPVNGSYTINKAQAVATAVDGGGTFNGSAFTGSGTCSHGLTGVIVYSGGSAPVNAGSTTFTVTCGDGGNNYIDGVDEGAIEIGKADATIDVDGFSGTYDGAAHGATGTATGVVSEDLSSLLDLGASFTNAPGGTASWSFAGNDNYNSASGTAPIAIAQKGVTASITAADKIYDGSNAATMTTCTVNGTIGADDVDCGSGTATFDNANAGVGKAVSATGLALSGAQAGNYDLDPTTAATTATISPKDVTTSITADDKVYDGNAVAAIATCTVNGRVGSDDVTCAGDAAFDNANAGVNKNVSSANMALAGSAEDNYNLTSTNAATTADITPAPVLVSLSADGSVRQYTDNLTVTVSVAAVNGSLTSQITGGLTGVAGTQTFVSGSALSATGTANVTLLPGNYTLTGTFVSSNSNFQSGTPATQPLTVNPEDATPKYTGDTWIQATSNGQATITLSAIVYDDSDGMTGSVANARVTFVDVNAGNGMPLGTCKDVRVNITDANLPTQGKATCAWSVTLAKNETSRTVLVGFAIAGSHKNKDAVATTTSTVVITRNVPYSMTGGGTVAGSGATSGWTGTVGGADFGMGVTYTNKLTNPQGGVWVKFSVGGVNYLARSNSLLNFSVKPGTTSSESIFSAKSNIINLDTGASVDGNSILQLSVYDGKTAGGADRIAITLNGKNGGLVYSNRWDRGTAKTLEEALAAGNIVINVK